LRKGTLFSDIPAPVIRNLKFVTESKGFGLHRVAIAAMTGNFRLYFSPGVPDAVFGVPDAVPGVPDFLSRCPNRMSYTEYRIWNIHFSEMKTPT
jgi:hypothetical protein